MLKRAMEASPTNFSHLLPYLIHDIDYEVVNISPVTLGITLGTEENRAIGDQPTHNMQRRNHESPPLHNFL